MLVYSNILLDVFSEDPVWFEWSSETLAELAERSVLVVNPIIYAEVSIRFPRIEDLDEALPADRFRREELPWEAAFLAGKCYLAYRRHGGERRSPLPDFYIGAHAWLQGLQLLTRDPNRFRRHFPRLPLVTPS